MSFEIRRGDVLERLREMPAVAFAGCLTDPPYGLGEYRSPQRKSGKRQNGTGFMGLAWDARVPGPETWAEVLRVLKPGAYLLAFGGTRTYHRLTCAIEDAGFEIRDCLMWLYGQGFPKAKSCLKPAWEPIILARKRGPMLPLAIDACRIETGDKLGGGATSGSRANHEGWRRPWMDDPVANASASERSTQSVKKAEALGRWPANVILDEQSGAALDAQSGSLISGGFPAKRNADKHSKVYAGWKGEQCLAPRGMDSGGASRFFYCAKASSAERNGNTHPTVKPLKLTEYLARLILPANGGDLIVPFSGSGSEMVGAQLAGWNHITGIEQDRSYIAIAAKRLRATGKLAIAHAA